MIKDKLELLQKVRNLAQQGVGGEAENAQKLLDKLMSKYEITEADLDSEEVTTHDFWFTGKYERKLLLQVVHKVTGSLTYYKYTNTLTGRSRRNKIGVNLTESQFIEVSFLFDFYKELYYEELYYFQKAFIAKHRIYNEDPSTYPDDSSTEDLKESSRISQMMRGLSDKSPIRRIENT